MAPAKLTEAEKETIFRLYRETDETTSTLSRQYGVSVSTISRLLKSKLSLEEYEDLVRLKRSGLNRNPDESSLDESFDGSFDESEEEDNDRLVDESTDFEPDSESTDLPSPRRTTSDFLESDRRRRRRSSATQAEESVEKSPEQRPEQHPTQHPTQHPSNIDQASLDPSVSRQPIPGQYSRFQPSEIGPLSTGRQLDLLSLSSEPEPEETESPNSFDRPILRKPAEMEPDLKEEQSLEEEEEDYVYSFGDEEFGDDDEDDFEDEEPEDETLDLAPMLGQAIEIIPLSEAHFPRTCYLVVDRTAELVTCRLQDFRELGQIPDTEAQHRTLPLFDNHRVARRFSRRNQRVIKLPDGRMLHKTARSLEAKGITRLLLDGKVYDLQERT